MALSRVLYTNHRCIFIALFIIPVVFSHPREDQRASNLKRNEAVVDESRINEKVGAVEGEVCVVERLKQPHEDPSLYFECVRPSTNATAWPWAHLGIWKLRQCRPGKLFSVLRYECRSEESVRRMQNRHCELWPETCAAPGAVQPQLPVPCQGPSCNQLQHHVVSPWASAGGYVLPHPVVSGHPMVAGTMVPHSVISGHPMVAGTHGQVYVPHGHVITAPCANPPCPAVPLVAPPPVTTVEGHPAIVGPRPAVVPVIHPASGTHGTVTATAVHTHSGAHACPLATTANAAGSICSWMLAPLVPGPTAASYMQCVPVAGFCGRWIPRPCAPGTVFDVQVQVCVHALNSASCPASTAYLGPCNHQGQCPGKSTICNRETNACCSSLPLRR